MIRHIVCWKFLSRADGGAKSENLGKAKTMIESLRGSIPEIRSLEVGIDLTQADASSDLVLNGTFDSVAALKAYQQQYDGAMYSVGGGGYLIVVSNEPVPAAFKVNVRLARK